MRNFSVFSQPYTPCSDCDTIPSRYEKYYYTQWYDECPYYATNGFIDSCRRQVFQTDPITGGWIAKWEYTSQPLKVKGLVALVDRFASHATFNDTTKLPEYVYLYQKFNEYYWDPDHPVPMGITLELVDSARWDTVKPHYMEFRQGDSGEVFNYCYAYEAYFNEPVYVDSSFFIYGSGNNRHNTNGVFDHIPTYYVAIKNSIGIQYSPGCPVPDPPISVPKCTPWGEWEVVYADNVGFHRPWPENQFGMFLAIVDQYTIDVSSDNTEYGSMSGSGRFPEEWHDTIFAIPNPGYKFTHWNDGNTDNPRVIYLTQDTAFTAFFDVSTEYYSVSLTSNNTEWGSVEGDGTYLEQSLVTISAKPNHFCTFEQWSDGDWHNPRTISLINDTSFMAIFSCDTLLSADITDIDEQNRIHFGIFPNPATEILNIQLDKYSQCHISIVDINGRTITNKDFIGESTAMDISNLTAGRYFVKVNSGNKRGLRSFVKK